MSFEYNHNLKCLGLVLWLVVDVITARNFLFYAMLRSSLLLLLYDAISQNITSNGGMTDEL
jgi:hypothetical protein